MKKGRLEVVSGCMSCGKSEELIRRLNRVEFEKRKAIAFSPKIDTRNKATIASRNGTRFESVEVESAEDILKEVTERHDVVGIDEAQFFDSSIISVINYLIAHGKRVIVSGLDTDFRGEPFGSMPQLLAIADSVKKMSAACMVCGNKATRTQRLIDGKSAPYDSPLIQVGGGELYEARCRNCHEVPRGEKVDVGEVVYQ